MAQQIPPGVFIEPTPTMVRVFHAGAAAGPVNRAACPTRIDGAGSPDSALLLLGVRLRWAGGPSRSDAPPRPRHRCHR